jgi:hypothetical protein
MTSVERIMINRRNFLSGLGAGAAVLAATSQFSSALAYFGDALRDGAVVSFRCLGHIPAPTVFLDGRTLEADVGLAPEYGGGFSGTMWRVARIGRDVIALECQGNLDGPRWLDGRTQESSVGLAPNSRDFSGTRWRVRSLDRRDPDIVALECLGNIPGNRWLDGRTQDATVGLASNTGPSGTAWRILG